MYVRRTDTSWWGGTAIVQSQIFQQTIRVFLRERWVAPIFFPFLLYQLIYWGFHLQFHNVSEQCSDQAFQSSSWPIILESVNLRKRHVFCLKIRVRIFLFRLKSYRYFYYNPSTSCLFLYPIFMDWLSRESHLTLEAHWRCLSSLFVISSSWWKVSPHFLHYTLNKGVDAEIKRGNGKNWQET